ncbi:MAG: alginate export family protein [Variovorax sp.]|nr:MAG: alginate export family protein [Variovorax sp.]
MKNDNRLNRTYRSATRSLAWSLLLAAAPDALGVEAEPAEVALAGQAAGSTDVQRPVPDESILNVEAGIQVAQFQLPPGGLPGGQSSPWAEQLDRYPERPLISRLTYQYSWGSESDITYRRNADLDRRLKDTSLILSPAINGAIVYRPTDRIEMMLEAILQRDIAVKEQDIVTLPSGETRLAPRHYNSLPIDQAWVTFKQLGPIDLTLGRRNFEDDRHWLYDTSLDTAFVRLKEGAFQAELSYSRLDRLDLDLLAPVQKTRNDTYMAYLSYRGIEDIRLAGYTIYREDQSGIDGQPLFLGLRASGMPSDRFNFWTELALLRGKDVTKKNFKGYGFDIGGTYRFPDLPYAPNITLGYAYGSGDGNPNDKRNHEFRQTGLESNEGRLGGIPKLRYYGEVLDPELSNLQIFTAAVGFRPAPNISVDLVYHRYKTNKLASDLRNSALTAEMNQDSSRPSKEVGDALDIVFGFRRLFGVQRLGLDLRTGLFFPRGDAFRNEVIFINPRNRREISTFRRADKGISVLAKFWF